MTRVLFLLVLMSLADTPALHAQDVGQNNPDEDFPGELVITLDEAIQIALARNIALEQARLNVQNASAQVREGWAELFPQVDVSSSYTRNFRTANPFTGSQAGGFFQSLGFIDWLSFNEQARTDGDDATSPITVQEFFARQQAGLEAAGIEQDGGGNPFGVPNQFLTGLSITQSLFDGRAFFGARGASRWLEPFTEAGLNRQQQLLVDEVRRRFYGALLAQARVDVSRESVARARRTLSELSRQVEEGTAPKFQRMTAAVELANLESSLTQRQTDQAAQIDALKLSLGINVSLDMKLRGALEADALRFPPPDPETSQASLALTRRPDLSQARINMELERIQLKVARAEFMPTLDAFFNYNFQGSVPDNRVVTSSDPENPFAFSSEELGFFSDAWWDRTVSGGFRVTWNVFNGMASRQRLEQRKIALRQAELDAEFLERTVQTEVKAALRDVSSARTRMISQQDNVQLAETNFEFAEARLTEGVASPIEVREASNQLDEARLNFLQATHDYLVALSAYQTALGEPTP
ncbi:MAG: transporter [Bacteroidetes bacterium CG12_big_fil_rev_8_21_14_0_65_60_17]|nr:MAG: transporter [Bacteroidetes bacterium CG12_big_fil_rev_8_21_14_0_65_60_17]